MYKLIAGIVIFSRGLVGVAAASTADYIDYTKSPKLIRELES